LIIAISLLALIRLCFRVGIRSLVVHGVLGILIWYAFVVSGVHAALAGVALGLLTPAKPWICEGKLDGLTLKIGNFLYGVTNLEQEDKF